MWSWFKHEFVTSRTLLEAYQLVFSFCSFRILNQRADPHFLFFSNITRSMNFSDVDVVAKSPNLTILNYNEPVQGHLAYTANQG